MIPYTEFCINRMPDRSSSAGYFVVKSPFGLKPPKIP